MFISGKSLLSLAVVSAFATAATRAPKEPPPRECKWLGEDLPLPLSVKNPEDLAIKSAAERQYLLFNLLTSGKIAWDKGDYSGAATKWEALLRTPGVPSDLSELVRPMALKARQQAGGSVADLPMPPPPSTTNAPPPAEDPGTRAASRKSTGVTVTGVVTGGAGFTPGGTVLFMKRVDGPTPPAKPGRRRLVLQKEKHFDPRVLAVTPGTTVEFRNDDPIFHNVFSLSPANSFDLGLYRGGTSKEQVFSAPGVVDLLCNIHSGMAGYIYVVDTPYFTQAEADGKFTIHGVLPGKYSIEAWHEAATKTAKQTVAVSETAAPIALSLDADRKPPAFVPDKYGKPRQPQLGY